MNFKYHIPEPNISSYSLDVVSNKRLTFFFFLIMWIVKHFFCIDRYKDKPQCLKPYFWRFPDFWKFLKILRFFYYYWRFLTFPWFIGKRATLFCHSFCFSISSYWKRWRSQATRCFSVWWSVSSYGRHHTCTRERWNQCSYHSSNSNVILFRARFRSLTKSRKKGNTLRRGLPVFNRLRIEAILFRQKVL